jgi:hypothetical protein
MEREVREGQKSCPSLTSNETYEAAPRRTRTKISAMALKATRARAATSPKEEGPPLLGSGVLGLVVALAAELVAVGEPLAEPLAPLTVTEAVISGCILQWYA